MKEGKYGFLVAVISFILFYVLYDGSTYSKIGYGIALALVVFLVFIINYSYRFMRRFNKLEKILVQDKNPQKFIEENRKLLTETSNPAYQAIIRLNMSNGYALLSNFEMSIKMLLEVDVKKAQMTPEHLANYYLNLAYYYFQLNDVENGSKVFETHQEAIKVAKTKKRLSNFYKTVELEYLVLNGKESEAREKIANILKTSDDKALLKDTKRFLDYLDNKNKH